MKRYAKIEYPLLEAIVGQNFKSLDDVIESGWDKLSAHYQTDMRKLKSKNKKIRI